MKAWRALATFAAFAVFIFSSSTAARADTTPTPTRTPRCGEPQASGANPSPWIRLKTSGLDPELRRVLLSEVQSSLSARRIDVCVSSEDDDNGVASQTRPLVTLEVSAAADNELATSLMVDDGVTHKRVSRDLDLRTVPSDGRALTIAIALDELLRASWAELLLADAQVEQRGGVTPIPSVVTDAIQSSPPRSNRASDPREPRQRKTELGAAMSGEHFTEGHDQLGADVIGGYAPWSRVGFHGRLGFRFGFPVQAPRGEIRATALAFTLGVDVAMLPRTGRFGVDLLLGGSLTRVTFISEPNASNPTARGNERSAAAGYVVVGTRFGYAIVSSLRGFVEVGGGVPLHTAYATDADVRVTGLGGLLLAGNVGVSTVF